MESTASEHVMPAVRQRTTILKILLVPAVIIATALTLILTGSTSHTLPPGKVIGVQDAVTSFLKFDTSIVPGDTEIAATLSGVNDYWARFLVRPTRAIPGFVGATGFAHFANNQWGVVAYGTATAGCPVHGHRVVPAAVLRGFDVNCASATGTN